MYGHINTASKFASRWREQEEEEKEEDEELE